MSDLYRDADPNPEKVGRTIYPREAAAEQRWVVKVELDLSDRPTLYQYEEHPECPSPGGEHREEVGTYRCRHCDAVDLWHRRVPVEPDDLRGRFHTAATMLWARGLPAPSPDEIADAMMDVVVDDE